MKKCLAASIVILAVSVIFIDGVNAQHYWGDSGGNPNPTIRVSGDAEVWVGPDEITVYSGVDIWGRDFDSTVTAAEKHVENILKLRQKYNIEPRHVQTDYISIKPQTKHINGYDVYGYAVQKSITFIIRDISQFDSFMKDIVIAGADAIHDVKFRTLELKKYREQVRSLAIRAAREKAEKLASELGQAIGPAITITEGSTYTGYWRYDDWGRRENFNSQVSYQTSNYDTPDPEGTVALGQIRVYASVNVTFGLR